MDNLRGILLMVASMAGFSLADTFIKMVSGHVPVGMILAVIGAGGTLIFGTLAVRRGEAIIATDILSPLMLLRMVGEIMSSLGFVLALATIPISTASAILQATPLMVTLGAAVFMREPVGWRRWTAIVIGFVGVLIVIRPGMEGFQAASLFAVVSVIGISIRDLSTRAAPVAMSAYRLGTYGFIALIPAGLLQLAVSGQGFVLPTAFEWGALGIAILADVLGYFALTFAMRMGDVAVITPFRYARVLFAVVAGFLVFGEVLDTATILGTAIVIGSGLYTFARERQRARQRAAP
jgi:drug/metabolite transporter (DMT)-like permease